MVDIEDCGARWGECKLSKVRVGLFVSIQEQISQTPFYGVFSWSCRHGSPFGGAHRVTQEWSGGVVTGHRLYAPNLHLVAHILSEVREKLEEIPRCQLIHQAGTRQRLGRAPQSPPRPISGSVSDFPLPGPP